MTVRRRKTHLRLALAGALALPVLGALTVAAPAVFAAPQDLKIELDVQSFTLDNGLRVYVVEDHSTPAFTFNMTYDVGSRDEVPGRTGFAHFFEHMMFQGSKNLDDNMIGEYTERAGGYINAATSFDQTVYFHAIPSQYLDMILWGEADRLQYLEITQEPFEVQRSAVKSEKDRSENQPFFKAFETLVAELFEGTPYAHMPIGSLEDLNAAEAKDAEEFFKTYYVPNNAVMVIVGDVDFNTVKERVTHYFGGIPRLPFERLEERGIRGLVVFRLQDSARSISFGVAGIGTLRPSAHAIEQPGVVPGLRAEHLVPAGAGLFVRRRWRGLLVILATSPKRY